LPGHLLLENDICKRLTVQLLVQGISPFAIELDNYFVDREKDPAMLKGSMIMNRLMR
jgi:uridine kinase